MTVSPRWPNDDTPPSSEVGNRVVAGENIDASMPPTLFRLPNLNRAMPESQPAPVTQQAPVQHQTPAQPQTPVQPQVQGPLATAQPTASANAASQVAGGNRSQAEQDQAVRMQENPPQDEVFAARPFPDLTTSASEIPVGRSWMEVARQHGVVVLLLLIVVATAVFTGRDKGIDDSQTGTVEAIALTEIDNGIVADVPLPAHTHDSQTGIVSSPNAVSVSPPKDTVSIEQSIDTNVETKEFSTAVASLEPPHTTAAPNNSDFGDPIIAKRGAGNEPGSNSAGFVSPSAGAQTVSNRVNGTDDSEPHVAFNPPSLDDLAKSLPDNASVTENSSVALPTSGGIKTNPNVPVSSKTPAGISDWSRYLPTLSNATSN